jgi:Epoxide hydrolase N terminus
VLFAKAVLHFTRNALNGEGEVTTATAIPEQSAGDAIRPFRVDIPEDALVDLRRRINATRWPERETVPDPSQGVQLATIQALARYWASEYDWRLTALGARGGMHI